MTPTDDDLLSALRSGDENALAQLLERHAPAVYRFGVKMCRDPEDAKDIVQDTLLAAARGLARVSGRGLAVYVAICHRAELLHQEAAPARGRSEPAYVARSG